MGLPSIAFHIKNRAATYPCGELRGLAVLECSMPDDDGTVRRWAAAGVTRQWTVDAANGETAKQLCRYDMREQYITTTACGRVSG